LPGGSSGSSIMTPPTLEGPELQGGVEAISPAEPGGYGEPHRQNPIIPHAPADRKQAPQ